MLKPIISSSVQKETEAVRPLFNITGELVTLFEIAENEEAGENERAYARAEIERIATTELAKKTDGIAWFDKHCDVQVDGLRQIKQEADLRISAWERRKQSVRDYVRQCMQSVGVRSLKGNIKTISLRAGSESVVVMDESALPTEYMRIIPEQRVPDKAAIAKAIRSGRNVPGAVMSRGEDVISIR
jgi:hypothetical protein